MLKLSRKTYFAVGLAGLNLAALTLPFVGNADTQQSNTTINLTINPVIISYSSGPTITLGAITPDSSGKQSTDKDVVSANTNDTAGLTITLEENSAVTTDMVSGGNSITATAGTTAAPIALVNGTWGWHVDGLDSFTGTGATISNAAPSSVDYAKIPSHGSPHTIKTTATNGSTSVNVWYSARVNNTQPIGTYSTTALYTISTN